MSVTVPVLPVTRHGRRKDAHADQSCRRRIHRQRRVRGHAAAPGRDGTASSGPSPRTGGDRERCVVAPAATVTEPPGTVAAAPLLLVSVTTAPPDGAALVSVTVPVLPALPVTAVGLTLTPSRAAAAGFTVSVAVLATPLYLAVMVTVVGTVTAALVVTANVAVVAPAATVTEPPGTVAAALLLVSVTTAPPVGAALPSVTVPVLPLPPVTAAGKTLTPTSRGFSVSVEFVDAPTHVAVMLACVGTVTTLVVTGNVALVAPAATVTEPETGTVAAPLLLLSVTTAPPDRRRAGERHRAGAVRRRRSGSRKGSASTNPAACSRREPD